MTFDSPFTLDGYVKSLVVPVFYHLRNTPKLSSIATCSDLITSGFHHGCKTFNYFSKYSRVALLLIQFH